MPWEERYTSRSRYIPDISKNFDVIQLGSEQILVNKQNTSMAGFNHPMSKPCNNILNHLTSLFRTDS